MLELLSERQVSFILHAVETAANSYEVLVALFPTYPGFPTRCLGRNCTASQILRARFASVALNGSLRRPSFSARRMATIISRSRFIAPSFTELGVVNGVIQHALN